MGNGHKGGVEDDTANKRGRDAARERDRVRIHEQDTQNDSKRDKGVVRHNASAWAMAHMEGGGGAVLGGRRGDSSGQGGVREDDKRTGGI